MDRMNRAASYIQGHMRMLYLSAYFQHVKRSVRTMQKIMKMYHVKNKIIKERLNEYFSKNKNSMEQLRALETAVIFKEFDGLNDLEDLENYTRVKFFEGEQSFRESIPHVESFIPSKPY
jgi:Fe-S cluster assembly ATPase SufC